MSEEKKSKKTTIVYLIVVFVIAYIITGSILRYYFPGLLVIDKGYNNGETLNVTVLGWLFFPFLLI